MNRFGYKIMKLCVEMRQDRQVARSNERRKRRKLHDARAKFKGGTCTKNFVMDENSATKNPAG